MESGTDLMTGGKKLKLLFKEIKIGNLKSKNRIVLPPMGLFFKDCVDGLELKPHVIAFYEAVARGGAGLMMISPSFYFSMLKGVDCRQPFGMWDNKFVNPMKKLVEAVHKHNALIGLHYTHMGSFASSALTGVQPVSASGDFRNPWTRETPRKLSKTEINAVVKNFAKAAVRTKAAGFDFIEYNAYSGYLIREFLSPAYNNRSDEYGGSLKNRLRFFKEIFYATKEATGSDYPVVAKISGDEFLARGNTSKEAVEIAKAIESWGADALHVSPGGHDSPVPLTLGFVPKGAFTYLARLIKAQVQVPVITAHVDDLFLAENILTLGHADLIGFGRQFLADHNFARKAKNGSFDDIRPCVRCNQGCYENVINSQNVTCLMNPALGREKEFKIFPVPKKKKIMIVGGGPGGLKSAEELAARGHNVSLYEKNHRLGGQLHPGAASPGKAEFLQAVDYFSTRLAKLGVDIHLNAEVTPPIVENNRPDVVIIATGAKQIIPDLPGIAGNNVKNAFDVLEKKVSTGNRVAIVGGGSIGCDTALLLAKEGTMDPETAVFLREWGAIGDDLPDFIHKGKKVTILEIQASIARDVVVVRRSLLRKLLAMNNVEIITEAEVTAITDQGVEFQKEGQIHSSPADTVVIAVGTCSENKLYRELKGKAPELYIIGDAQKPGKAINAIHEAAEMALKI